MAKLSKKIIRVGSSAGIVIDNAMLTISELKIGDTVEFTCSKNRIVIKKVEEKGDK